MATVKPISDLRNRFKNISTLVHKKDEPIIITKNGESNMVVMSYDHYKKITTKMELYEKLAVAEAEDATGAPTYALDDVIKDVKKSLGF